MKKTLSLLAILLALACISFASAKSYSIYLTRAAVAGKQQLNAGEYKVKVDGAQVVFTDVKTSKSVTIPAKVETGNRTFKATAVDTSAEGSGDRINAIELGGSTTKVEFAY